MKTMIKKIIGKTAVAIGLFLPAIALAAEEKTQLHIFYEKSFGPIGAIAGFIAIIAMWQMAKKVEKNFSFTLKMFAWVLLLINVGSIAFGIHGAGVLDGETSRYIERTCRLTALLSADVAALMLFLRLTKKKESGTDEKPADNQPIKPSIPPSTENNL